MTKNTYTNITKITIHRLSAMADNKTTKVKTVSVPRRKDGEIDGRCKTEKLLKQNKTRDNRSTKTVDTCGNSTRIKKIGIPKRKMVQMTCGIKTISFSRMT